MIKTTRWRPDTCECDIEYSWDDSLPIDNRIHTISKIFFTCPAHVNLITKEDKYLKILEENQKKNKVYDYILENAPDLVNTNIELDGTVYKQLIFGKKYVWSFDENRILEIDVVDDKVSVLTEKHKANLKKVLDKEFPNQVKIK